MSTTIALPLSRTTTHIHLTIILYLSVGLLTTFVARPTAAQELSEAERKEGFVSIFNGKDFDGWSFDGVESPPKTLPPNWSVTDGVILLAGGGFAELVVGESLSRFRNEVPVAGEQGRVQQRVLYPQRQESGSQSDQSRAESGGTIPRKDAAGQQGCAGTSEGTG